jgi:hypothetical protein
MDRRIFFARVLPWLVTKKNKTKFQILPAPRGEHQDRSHPHDYSRWRPCLGNCFTNIRHQGAAFYPEAGSAAVPEADRSSGVSTPEDTSSNLGDISLMQPYHGREFLIANLRLKFTANPTKLSARAKSNRKYFAIFHSRLSLPRVTSSKSRVTDFLIANARLKFPATQSKQTADVSSNRERIAIFHPLRVGSNPAIHATVISRLSSVAEFLIGTFANSEFRSTRYKHRFYSISNRYKNAHFGFCAPAYHGSHATNHNPRITSHATFRSTIPRGQNAHH